ncbi:MAG: MOSC domain-containing protein [Alphaproteobacteria bacterium]
MTTVGTIASLTRYPVKGMAGEALDDVEIVATGLLGDRAYALVDPDTGERVTSVPFRKRHRLLDWRAAFVAPPLAGGLPPCVTLEAPDGATLSSERDDIGDRLSERFGKPVLLAADRRHGQRGGLGEDAVGDFNAAPVHVLTSVTLDRLARLRPETTFAARRFRPNIVLETATGLDEATWIGRRLRLGATAALAVLERTVRCAITTLAQGDLAQDPNVLGTINVANGTCLGLYARVEATGVIRIGDTVRLED